MSIRQQTLNNDALLIVPELHDEPVTHPADEPLPSEVTDNWTRIDGPSSVRDRSVTFRLNRWDIEHVQTVQIYYNHVNEARAHVDAPEISGWVITWGDDSNDTVFNVNTEHYTPSFADARRVLTTLLVNLLRVDTGKPGWRESVASFAGNVDTMTIEDFNRLHSKANREYEQYQNKISRIHWWARDEWESIKQGRQRRFDELVEMVEAERNGETVQETLPPADQIPGVTKWKRRFVEGECCYDEFVGGVGAAINSAEFITIDEYLDQVVEEEQEKKQC